MRNKKEIKKTVNNKSESCCDSTCCGSSVNKEKATQSNSEIIQPDNKRGK